MLTRALLLSAITGQTPVAEQGSPNGYLYQPVFCVDHELAAPHVPLPPARRHLPFHGRSLVPGPDRP